MNPVILVVDDSPVNREVCRRSLQKSFEIVEAESGEEALQIAAERRPNLILLDIVMDGLDGFGVLEKLQSNPETKQIPVMLLTANGEIADKQRGFQLGADDYITKPFDRLELLARVEARLRKVVEENVRIEQARTDARSKAVAQLLITISHHINNALTILLGNVQIVNPDDPEKVQKMIEIVHQQSERIRIVMEVLYNTAEQMELKPVDGVGRKEYFFDINAQLKKRMAQLEAPEKPADWV